MLDVRGEHGLLGRFWVVFAAFFLAVTWLLPNHTPPWRAFHSEAWCALVLLLVGAVVVARTRGAYDWSVLAVLTATMMFIPSLQYLAGQIYFFGTAWVSTLYLAGFLLALLVGRVWEKRAPSEAGDFIFLAIIIAGFLSVLIQINQWVFNQPLGFWLLFAPGPRFYANLGQPNQLASLLVLAIIGILWLHLRWRLNGWLALMLSIFLVLGIALTASRTAGLNLIVLLGVAALHRHFFPSSRYLFVMVGLCVLHFILALLIPLIGEVGDPAVAEIGRLESVNARFTIWEIFLEASFKQPWLGYGWGGSGAALFAVQPEYPFFGTMYKHPHNFFLDLIVYMGYPLAIPVLMGIFYGIWKIWRSIASVEQLIMFAFVVVLVVHALLEFPLHYAYFILPLGLIIGALDEHSRIRAIYSTGPSVGFGLFVAGVIAWGVTISDYFKVETSFYGLRLDEKKILNTISKMPPDVLVLDQWREHLRLARNVPIANAPVDELEHLRKTAIAEPSGLLLYKYVANLILNGHMQEAAHWRSLTCKMVPRELCQSFEEKWDALLTPETASDVQSHVIPY